MVHRPLAHRNQTRRAGQYGHQQQAPEAEEAEAETVFIAAVLQVVRSVYPRVPEGLHHDGDGGQPGDGADAGGDRS